MTSNNPFEMFQGFMNQETISKYMKWTPNMDFNSVTNMFKESSEVMSSTSQLISDSLQSVAKRGADSFQKNTSEMFSTMKEAISAGDMDQVTNCQQNYLRSAVENNINNAKEILDITSKSSMEILDVLERNFTKTLNKTSKAKH